MKKIYILGLAACTIMACKPNLQPEKPSAGTANFEKYLAIGNSLTAGYSNNSLYRSGQENSYPALLAKQFQLVGGGEFKQPVLPGDFGYPNPKLVLVMKQGACSTEGAMLTPAPFPGATDSAGSAANVGHFGPYNNVGIPGLRVVDLMFPGYANFNPYAKRLFRNIIDRPMEEILRISPTFFSVWLGNNDVLGYATGGGAESSTAISSREAFQYIYDSLITKLTINGAKGVIMNIPDITSIPFFTTVPYDGLTLTNIEANNLNVAYKAANIPIRFEEGKNRFVIQDDNINNPSGRRQIRQGELLLLSLPQDSIRCKHWGSEVPIPAKYVLTEHEVDSVKNAISAFNTIITNIANSKHVPIVDMNSYMRTLQSGITYNGIAYNPAFVSGGVFSLDGVHLTERGYAIVANFILQTINHHYEASIPMVDPNEYEGIEFP